VGYRNRDEGAITRRVQLNEFALLNFRRMREGSGDVDDCERCVVYFRVGAGRVKAVLFVMIGVRAVKMVREAYLHQNQEQREDQRYVSVGLRDHGYLRTKP
jgi:hypothetical protein